MSKIDETTFGEADEQRLANGILENLAKSLLINGDLNEEDLLNERVLFSKISNVLKASKIEISVDYRETLEKYANSYFKDGDYNMAIVMSCMFFEHTINGIMVKEIEKKDIELSHRRDILKTLRFDQKMTWMLRLLGLPKFNQTHLRNIREGMKLRNSFVHYKYPIVPDDPDEDESDKLKTVLENLFKAIVYFKRYESRTYFNGNKGKLENLMKTKKSK
jgi:hypothetical protein